jgi:hypothetical protein
MKTVHNKYVEITSLLLAATILVCTAAVLNAAVDQSHSFAWREANMRMSGASTVDDFAGAADVYRELVGDGLSNGPLFYNLGTALLLSEQYAAAEKAFYRSERYMGSNEDIRRNLELALARSNDSESVTLPWYRAFLFWHYGLPGNLRTCIALAAFSLVWIGFAFRIMGLDTWGRHVMAAAIVVLILFGSSVASTLYAENGAGRAVLPDATGLTRSVSEDGNQS